MRPARTEAFSDGVFAIAVTLLVLDLHVPHVGPGGLAAALGALWPTYAAYVVSFGTIGIIWINHHAVFDRLDRVDRPLLFLNLLFLLTVTVLPFPTSLMSAFLQSGRDGGVAAAVYCLNMAVMGVAFSLLVVYATRRRLMTDDALEAFTARFQARFTVGTPLYLLAAALAFVDPRIGLGLCALLAVYYALLSWPGRGRAE